MIPIHFSTLKTVLCLGAHADDIEIGCGGTLLKLQQQQPGLRVCWVVFSGEGVRGDEARRSAELFLRNAGESQIIVKNFRDTLFPYDGERIKAFFRELSGLVSPDLIFTHRREDLHQDHRLLAELTWNTFRNHLIMEYEIPKFEGDLGHPNLFVSLEKSTCQQKIDLIRRSFPSQADKPWFTEDTFFSLMRLRGVECQSPGRYAEAFYCRKLLL